VRGPEVYGAFGLRKADSTELFARGVQGRACLYVRPFAADSYPCRVFRTWPLNLVALPPLRGRPERRPNRATGTRKGEQTYIAQTDAVTEFDAVRIAAMFAANT